MKKVAFSAIALIGLLLFTGIATAIERNVPSEYATIQDAINACSNGDVVIIAPGTYTGDGNRDIDFLGKAITVRSTIPADPCVVTATIIDCQDITGHRGFYFHSGETSNSIISGLTIKNGNCDSGAGIYCTAQSNPLINLCNITNNTASAINHPTGAGIYCYQSSPTIIKSKIMNNTANGASSSGGGIYVTGGSSYPYVHCYPVLLNCIISGNSANSGGGILCTYYCYPEIKNCLIMNNSSSSHGGGIYIFYECNTVISNCTITNNSGASTIYSDYETNLIIDSSIFWNNSGGIIIGLYYYGTCTVLYSDIQGGYSGTGNINSDPMLSLDGYHLYSSSSPCVDAGNPSYNPQSGETDIDNESRIINGRIDIGVDEFNSIQPMIEISSSEYEFSSVWNGPNPSSQILSIRNGGAGTLEWQITENCDWLEAYPASGSSSGNINEVTLTVDSTGIYPGSYSYDLVVSGNVNNSPQYVRIILVVTGISIGLTETQHKFFAVQGGINPPQQKLGILNNGGEGTLNWQISEGCSWLSAEPTSGSSTGEIDDVNLSVDISGLNEDQYTCSLMISDPNAPNSPQAAEIILHLGDVDGYLNVPSEYPTIQTAIDMASNGDSVVVAPGTYTGSGNKDLDFGGKVITVRSSDPNDPVVIAATIIDCQNSGRGFYFHSGEGSNSIIAGITIINGQNQTGSGIYCSGASPTIEYCIISNCGMIGANGSTGQNGQEVYGGGLYCEAGSSPTLRNCTFMGNFVRGGTGGPGNTSSIPAGNGGNAFGGAVYGSLDSSVYIYDCNFISNEAHGGDVYNAKDPPYRLGQSGDALGGGLYGNISLIDCVIYNNTAIGGYHYWWFAMGGGDGLGGGIYETGNDCIIKNCLIIENSTTVGGPDGYTAGGGVHSAAAGSLVIQNCSICNNAIDIWTSYGAGGIHGNSSTNVINCIMWDNIIYDVWGCSVTFSCIEDSYSGTGNIHSDPCFIAGPEGNYYLSQIAAGQIFNSPCVDAGSDTAAIYGMSLKTTRTDELSDTGTVDMGYHYPIGYGSPDLNRDAFIDFFDFAILADNWLTSSDLCDPDSADIVKDGRIDFFDLAQLLANWLSCLVTSATNPLPADNATNISRNVVLRWSPGENTLSHDVYFGTSLNEVYDASTSSAQFMGNQDANYWDTNSFSPGGLDANKIYYWRIDEAGPVCTAKGNIWKFTTMPQPPGQASNPVPTDGATETSVTTDLSWTHGDFASSHDVYFGTANPPPFKINQTGTTYDTGTMDTNTTYYWRIDEKNAGGTTTGNLWSFKTIVQLPGQAGNPTPVDGAINVSIVKDINWTAGTLATSHDVYFGTTNPPQFQLNQTGTTYDTGTMDTNTTYYWRIDEKNASGTTTGILWNFTTGSTSEVNDANLVAWWKLDETTGATAYDSKGSNNGTVNGTATWTTGKIGGALSFNGSSNYVNCGSGVSNYDNISVSAWMNTSTQGALVTNRYNSTGYGTWYTLFSTGIELGGNSSGVGYMNVTFAAPTLNGLWHHVVYTKNGTSHALYVDGSLDQSFTSNADISWAQPLFIGKKWTSSNPSWFNGMIDDVRIYNRALTGDEVALLWQQGQ